MARQSNNNKQIRSFYIDMDVYNDLAELAECRSFFKGERNSMGQPVGAATLIIEAAKQYRDEYKDELERYRQLKKSACIGDANRAFEHAYEALTIDDEYVTVRDMATYLNSSDKVVRMRARDCGYNVANGIITKDGDAK